MDKNQKQKSLIGKRIEKKDKKKVFVILDTTDHSLNYAKKIISLLFPIEVVLVFYIKDSFSIEGKIYKNINLIFGPNDSCINLLPYDKEISKKVEKQINLLGKNTFFESTDKKILFSSKNNIKNILKNRKVQTPIFQLLGNREADETYLSFTQPSRIFSKKNDFYSGKINSIKQMNKVFKKINHQKRSNYLIEEYIEGQDIYAFVFKYNDKIIVYSVVEQEEQSKKYLEKIKDNDVEFATGKRYTKLEGDLVKEVKEKSKDFFEIFKFEKFALLHFKNHQKRGLYFLNAVIDHTILDDSRKNIVKNIFKKEGLSFDNFAKRIIF
ncbi:hypothetical protein CSB11_01140 [Candidatus Campbellbacteria bacterium]|nr:MAG: hypothetical protein CSB11_01140 [Candidatus Campbellbacteria bacterium]